MIRSESSNIIVISKVFRYLSAIFLIQKYAYTTFPTIAYSLNCKHPHPGMLPVLLEIAVMDSRDVNHVHVIFSCFECWAIYTPYNFSKTHKSESNVQYLDKLCFLLSSLLMRSTNNKIKTKTIWSLFSRHGLIVTTTKQSQLKNESKCLTSSNQSTKLTHQIQETNINTTIIDILEKSASDCPLTEPSLKNRLDKYLKKDNKSLIISSETKQNLNKLQKITDDVKLLTKQLELSMKLNKNNNSSLGEFILFFFQFCETRSKTSVEVYRGRNLHSLTPPAHDRRNYGHVTDRRDRERPPQARETVTDRRNRHQP